ncbi:hypothetical protein OLEAN_C24900 [Oleispira antarctica RB-8]|uniref:Uncharacterized protein n=1 Tax=Oleispira antarctica RB-8 TaxID=698738 RepID=R4YNL3_OLEAN|nr:hypothetical protein OLEAN_C24900 [Oleispira antarctica RB-8]
MTKKDITKEILAIHAEETLSKIMADVRSEMDNGMPEGLSSELDMLLKRAKGASEQTPSNIVAFKPRSQTKIVDSFGSTELLAAAGQSLGDWFSQPMSFGGAGFILDVRRVIGSENEVDIYLSPNNSDKGIMEKTLSAYMGKSVEVVISNNGEPLLEANLYIDEAGGAAEGSGVLVEANKSKAVKGNLSIDVVIKG